jgi:hypothetical protein
VQQVLVAPVHWLAQEPQALGLLMGVQTPPQHCSPGAQQTLLQQSAPGEQATIAGPQNCALELRRQTCETEPAGNAPEQTSCPRIRHRRT